MSLSDLNVWAILLAAVSSFVLGGLWYGPLFKDSWCRLAGVDPEKLFAEVRDFAETRLQPEMRQIEANAGFSWRELSAFPGLNTPTDAEITTAAKSLAQVNGTAKVAYGTEAGLIQQIGIPTVICGPGNIAQAHKPDEWVELSQIRQCETFMDRLAARLAR